MLFYLMFILKYNRVFPDMWGYEHTANWANPMGLNKNQYSIILLNWTKCYIWISECKIADIAISKLHIDGYWYGVMEIENNTHWTWLHDLKKYPYYIEKVNKYYWHSKIWKLWLDLPWKNENQCCRKYLLFWIIFFIKFHLEVT